MRDDVQRKAERIRADENQPLRRIKNLVRRIGGHRLPAAPVWIPPGKLAAKNRVPNDPLHRKVIDEEIAEPKVVAEKENVSEEERGDGDEQERAPEIGPPLVHPPRPAILKTMGMMTKSCTPSKTPWAMMPGIRFLVR